LGSTTTALYSPSFEAAWIHCLAGAAITRGLAVAYDQTATGGFLGWQVGLAGAQSDLVCGVATQTVAAGELVLVQCYGVCDFATTDGTVADGNQVDSNASGVMSDALATEGMSEFAVALDDDVGTVGKIFIKNCM
jgi:hypothetical protein